MEKYEIFMSNQSEKELSEVIYYVSDILLNHTSAKQLFTKISKMISSLETLPKRFPTIDDSYISRTNIRKCIVDNYIIIYIVNDNIKQVQISHIFYASRDWMKLL